MEKHKTLLILSFYYPPDLCAGSFRTEALVAALKDEPVHLHVVTTMPNRYHNFQHAALSEEQQENLRISRIQLPEHNSGFLDQARAFFTYYREAKKLAKQERYTLVFATSSRLLTAFLGAKIAKQQRCPLFLDIRDIFTDTMNSILRKPLKYIFSPIFHRIEKYTLKQASAINFVSEGFASYFDKKLPASCQVSYISNGIDACFLNRFDHPVNYNHKKIRILYAGNIGEGQGLEKIIPNLAKAMHDQCEFIIIGNGGRLSALTTSCESLSNIHFINPMNREKLIEAYQDADVLFLHLNNYPAFERVLPSKLFEYAATGKAILAGVPGFAAHFIQTQIEGAFIFNPCDEKQGLLQLQQAIQASKTYYPRSGFKQNYARQQLMKNLAKKVLRFI